MPIEHGMCCKTHGGRVLQPLISRINFGLRYISCQIHEFFFQVDMIVGHRTIKGRRQFLVRWKGYSNSSDSWENEKDLNCPQLIEDFLANEKEEKEIKPAKTKATKSKKPKGSSKKQTENGTLSSLVLFA